jgi:hypothetical protein
MNYQGEERRKGGCGTLCPEVLELELTIKGNGKPGLKQDMHDVKRALYGDKQNQVPGVIVVQRQIFVMLVILIVIVSLMAMKILGVPAVAQLLKHFTG